jgi:hypothetical protein
MDKILDRLFGRGRTGWLKTAMFSGLLGLFGTFYSVVSKHSMRHTRSITGFY